MNWQQKITPNEDDMRKGCVFTYTEEDPLLPADELARRMTTSRSSNIPVTQLTANVLGFTQRNQTAEMVSYVLFTFF